MTDITAVLTVHAEGVLAGPSLVSFEEEIEFARGAGLDVEGLIILDRPNPATRLQFIGAECRHRIVFSDAGDPGLARNAAVAVAKGAFVSFLDGDDLWGHGWLTLAHQFCSAEPDKSVAHSEFNVIFGEVRQVWWHADSRHPAFDPGYLRIGNYWDAMSFAARSIYTRYPFAANDLRRGFGHEDWHWNCVTLAAGIDHRPVAGTVHFKRRRQGSQMALCDTINAVPWVTPLSSYGWAGRSNQSMHEEQK
jgi:hypothetical protein